MPEHDVLRLFRQMCADLTERRLQFVNQRSNCDARPCGFYTKPNNSMSNAPRAVTPTTTARVPLVKST